MKEIPKEVNVLVYDDKDLYYKTGLLVKIEYNQDELIDITTSRDNYKKVVPARRAYLQLEVNNFKENDCIKLNDTLMKRIAKYNKEVEVQKVEEKIKIKKKQLKELEEKIEDREQRWKKIQEFVANIYELPLEDDEDYNDYEYYD